MHFIDSNDIAAKARTGVWKARLGFAAAALAACTVAMAAPAEYIIDGDHTYPSVEADHMGISLWRGKINKTSGRVLLDKTAGTGTVDLTIDLSSIDFGQEKLNEWAVGKDFFDVAKYPQATYKGKLEGFNNGVPSRVVGELTLRGVTKPVTLKVNSFKCIPHPMAKRDYCGADALATIKRDEFGLTAGKDYGFSMDVVLRIQVEALKAE
jgi:polyisoprenoid-binding protein YceI